MTAAGTPSTARPMDGPLLSRLYQMGIVKRDGEINVENMRLANGYQVVNRVDAGGQYMSQWETGRAAWITLIVRLNEPTLPKTGY